MTKVLVVLATALSLSACGGESTAGIGTVTGSVGGLSMDHAAEAISIYSGAPTCLTGSSNPGSYLSITIDDRGSACPAIQQVEALAHATMLHFQIILNSGGAIKPGTYLISQPYTGPLSRLFDEAVASFGRTTEDCLSAGVAFDATGGTLTIDALDASGVAGSFQLDFAEGSLSGSFTTANCTVQQSTCAVQQIGCFP
jgi:hypothetical protein